MAQRALSVLTFVILACVGLSRPPKHPRAVVYPAGWHTEGNRMVDGHGQAIRFCGITWYGFETETFVVHGLWAQDYKYILDGVKANGFNMIRLPFSNQVVESNPVPAKAINFTNEKGPINTDLRGLTSLEVMDKVIAYAESLQLYIVLDNHRSEAGNSAESSGLWYTDQYPESAWLKDWNLVAQRYKDSKAVIGLDLRNEPHNAKIGGACWTGDTSSYVKGCLETDLARNWPKAAERAGNALLSINPGWLMFVEGVDDYNDDWYWNGGNLEGMREHPVALATPNKIVYSAHEYGPRLYPQPWFNAGTTLAMLSEIWTKHWGFIEDERRAPVWLGEFGTENRPAAVQSDAPGSQGQWFGGLIQYIQQHPDLSWTYWALNGNDPDSLLDNNFAAPAYPQKMTLLANIAGVRK